MKKQILEALKAKFSGVSDQILDRIATRLATTVTTAEQVATAVEGVTFQQVLDSYGDARATQAQQTAVKHYEERYGLKDGVKLNNTQQTTQQQTQQQQTTQQQTQQQQTTQQQEQIPAWAQQLIDGQKTFNDRIAAIEGARITSSRKTQLDAVLSKLPEQLRKPYERMSLDGYTDEQFATELGTITSEVDAIVQQSAQRGMVFSTPSVQQGNGQTQQLSKEQIAAISHRDGTTSSDGQPF